jgi:hypothetical protein
MRLTDGRAGAHEIQGICGIELKHLIVMRHAELGSDVPAKLGSLLGAEVPGHSTLGIVAIDGHKRDIRREGSEAGG